MISLRPGGTADFRHEALMYAGEAGFLAGALPFVLEGLAAGENILVIVDSVKIELLRTHLGAQAGRVTFMDVAEVGVNPARLIPARRAFVEEYGRGGGRVRGIGEPIRPGRSQPEIIEGQLHEALVNLAFGDTPLWLLCCYDVEGLDASVLVEAFPSHPFVAEGRGWWESARYEPDLPWTLFATCLPEPPSQVREIWFRRHELADLRRVVARWGELAGLDAERVADLVLAVHELAVHCAPPGGTRRLRLWKEQASLLCEIHAQGSIGDPLAGRRRPPLGTPAEGGLWLANQLCDLVQLRSGVEGTTARLHMGLPEARSASGRADR